MGARFTTSRVARVLVPLIVVVGVLLLWHHRPAGRCLTTGHRLLPGQADDEHNVFGYPAQGRLLRRIGYTIGHDGGLRVPLWVSYHLHRDYATGRQYVDRQRLRWRADDDLSAEERATDADYKHSGYARGHMAMQSDMRGRSDECERQAYRLSNVVPQKQSLNGGAWLALENQAKRWACRWDEVWILCGPIFDDEPPTRLQGDRKDIVAIPTHFYKIIVRPTINGIEAIAFLVPHEPLGRDADLSAFLVSIDEIESRTDLDFLADLDDAIEDALEAAVPTTLWPDGSCN